MSFSPTLGRFLERDPAEYVDGLNPYEYERSNPLRYLDPMGTQAQEPATRPTDVVKGRNGEWTIKAYRMRINVIVANPSHSARAWISYTPNPDKCPKCKTIRLIQAVRVTTDSPKSPDFTWPEEWAREYRFPNMHLVNEMKSKSRYFIDHAPGKKLDKATSPYYNDSYIPSTNPGAAKERAALDGSALAGQQIESPRMRDTPIFRKGLSFYAEVVAQCVETGELLDSITWGYNSTDGEDLPSLLAPKALEAPSQDFLEALTAFSRFYYGDANANFLPKK